MQTCEETRLHEDTKLRKGLGTSPFGPPALTTVPIPCAPSSLGKPPLRRPLVGRSVLRSPFSVLRGASAPLPRRGAPESPVSPASPVAACGRPYGTSQTCRGCREDFSLPGRGAAPHSQSANLPISQSANSLCAPSWSFVSFVTSRNTSPLSSALFVARLSRAPWPWKVWRFAPARSVLRSPFSGASARRRLP